jgi:sugar phosphate isomerase/epimerase
MNTYNLLTRRQFMGKIMYAATGAMLLSGCKTSRWQIGCFTRGWVQYDYRVAFDGIAQAGFKYVGLMNTLTGLIISTETTPEQALGIKEEANSRGLKIISVWSNIGEGVKVSVAKGVADMKRIVDNVSICESPSLLVGGGGFGGNVKLLDDYYKVIAECADYAAEKGVLIALKNHAPLNTLGKDCREMIEKVGHKNFRIFYDPGNIYAYTNGEINPVDDVKDVDGLVAGLCVKDFVLPRNVNITPGTGIVDFPKLMDNLQKGGFTQGPLIVEAISREGDLAYINAEAAKAYQFVEELVR